MIRSLCALVALVLTAYALSAPAPQTLPAGLRKPVDPDKDCNFRHDKGTLTIEMPGTDHDYDPLRERVNAPRFLRDLEGDFVIQVRVHIERRPSDISTVQDHTSCVAAGVLIIPPDSSSFTCFRMEYGLSREGIGSDGYAALKHRDIKNGRMNGIWDCGWKPWPLPEKADNAYLRLERRKNTFYPSLSPDGEKWTPLFGPMGFGRLTAKLTVGLAAYSTSSERSKVRFDQIKLTQGKKKAR